MSGRSETSFNDKSIEYPNKIHGTESLLRLVLNITLRYLASGDSLTYAFRVGYNTISNFNPEALVERDNKSMWVDGWQPRTAGGTKVFKRSDACFPAHDPYLMTTQMQGTLLQQMTRLTQRRSSCKPKGAQLSVFPELKGSLRTHLAFKHPDSPDYHASETDHCFIRLAGLYLLTQPHARAVSTYSEC
ncbi:LOW QUALITY PROTEIN: hypothetical protein MAR_007758 [Mya arenaria]|uniref:Uncharacterized protein n=1 Tax=Mya arenaria TaxID=6604 RepID=A0ABY7DUR7_MYAAR|nr:LOW QUALITY PROTEIN: hypothetical protein MAR_007758 [Mya arenaria]